MEMLRPLKQRGDVELGRKGGATRLEKLGACNRFRCRGRGVNDRKSSKFMGLVENRLRG